MNKYGTNYRFQDHMTKYLESLLISILSLLLPIKATIVMVALMAIADLVSGIMASTKNGKNITSSGIRRTINKIIIYEFGLVISFLAETYLMGSILPITKLIAGLVAVTELKSIFENLDIFNGSPIFATIIQKIGSTNDTTKPKKD